MVEEQGLHKKDENSSPLNNEEDQRADYDAP